MNTFTNTTRVVGIAMLVAALVGNAGCAKMSWQPSKMLSLDNTWPFRDKDAPHEGTPTRMAATWTDTVLSQPGKKSQRGFGGRIMFYEQDEKKPILVDGQLVVYAFDEAGRDPTDNKPTRRYVFPADQLPPRMSKSELGASYSFFLPWDEAGGPKTEVSLICRFEPKDGAVVSSEQARSTLPGSMLAVADGARKPPKLPEGVPSKPAIPTLQSLQTQRTGERNAQQASYETAAPNDPRAAAINGALDANGLPTRRMTATTINLPGNFQMPSAAVLMNQNTPTAGNVQPAAPSYQQPLPNQPIPPQTAAMYQAIPPAAPAAVQPLGVGRALPGAQPMTQTPAGQTPMMQPPAQQAAQQAALQQQLLQQKLMLQQALQRTPQPQIPLQQSAQQIPGQAGGAATVSYPAAGQYPR